ncbi:DUF2339 domain-containing protein [Risungbinella massiliensis]|uniref:DUF2339 domain-containing protein n=1 Tax=Risungbinella massiliensis TaxID=1329796 RepID=UPI0005CBC94E|nr:DUF2339 domain-containing protein [Risungbinella massiliensis]
MISLLLFFAVVYLYVDLRNEKKERRNLENNVLKLENVLSILQNKLIHSPENVESKLEEKETQRSATKQIAEPNLVELVGLYGEKAHATSALANHKELSDQQADDQSNKTDSLLPNWWKEEWEILVGGKVFNRIGAVALVLGIGFFLKYAFDHDWFMMWTRVAIGMIVGFALLGIGRLSRSKGLTIFAQGAVGAGVGTMYLTVYAADNFYGLVHPVLAMIWMSGVTIIAFQQALSYNSVATSWLAWFGGALTPFLFPMEVETPLKFYLYFFVFTATLLTLLWKKPEWTSIYLAHVPITYIVLLKTVLFPDAQMIHLSAILCFWFAWMIWEYIQRKQSGAWMQGFSLFHPFITWLLFHYTFIHYDYLYTEEQIRTLHAFVFLGTAVLFALPLLYAKWKKTYEEISLFRRYGFQSVFFLCSFLATTIYWSGTTLATVLAIEATIFALWGIRYSKKISRYFSMFVWILAALLSFASYEALLGKHNWIFLNREFLPFALLIVGVFLVMTVGKQAYQPYIQKMHIAWITVWGIGISIECLTVVQPSILHGIRFLDRFQMFAVLIMIMGIALFSFAIRRKYLFVQYYLMIWIIIPVGVLMLAAPSTTSFSWAPAVLNVRTALFLLVIVLLIHWRRMLKRGSATKVSQILQQSLPIGVLLLLFEWINIEVAQFFDKLDPNSVPSNTNIELYGVAALWGLFSLMVFFVLRDRRDKGSLYLAEGILFLGAMIVGVVALERTPMLPVFNERFLAFMVIIAAVVLRLRWKDRFAYSHQSKWHPYIYPMALLLLLFEMISVEVWTGIQYTLPSWDSLSIRAYNLKQLGLSMVWLQFATILLSIGIWRKWKKIRLAALIFLGVTICKIFLLDLSFLITVYRITSFVVLGVILLATSFIYQRHRHWFLEVQEEK